MTVPAREPSDRSLTLVTALPGRIHQLWGRGQHHPLSQPCWVKLGFVSVLGKSGAEWDLEAEVATGGRLGLDPPCCGIRGVG